MFELQKELVKISNITNRIEFHGDDEKTAHDIKIEARLHNSVLLKLSPTLKDALYTKDPGATEDMINPDHAPKLRNPEMQPFNWDHKLPKVEFRIHHGERDEDDIVFQATKVKKLLSIAPQEGGTVALTWTVQVVQEDEMQGARLLSTLNKTVKISMVIDENALDDDDDDSDGEHPDNVHDLFPAQGQSDQDHQHEDGEVVDAEFEEPSGEEAEPAGMSVE